MTGALMKRADLETDIHIGLQPREETQGQVACTSQGRRPGTTDILAKFSLDAEMVTFTLGIGYFCISVNILETLEHYFVQGRRGPTTWDKPF